MQGSPERAGRSGSATALIIAERLRTASERRTPGERVGALVAIAVELDACDAVGVIGAVACPAGRGVSPTLATDELAAGADRVQCERGGGPALAAMHTGRPVIASDVSTDSTWIGACAPAPVRGVLAVPLDPERPVGALTFYSRAPRPFTDDDRSLAATLAAHVCVALRQDAAHDTLVRAVRSRTVIGQAQGILMARHRLDADQAFAVLARCSQHRNVKLAVLAQELAATGTLAGLPAALDALPRTRTPS